MKRFCALCRTLDNARSSEHALRALVAYLLQTPPADAAWAVYLLAAGRLRRAVSPTQWREMACGAAGLPGWLFDTSRAAVGDAAETLALFLPAPQRSCTEPLSQWMHEQVLPLRGLSPADQTPLVLQAWDALEVDERRLFNKLLSGGTCAAASPLRVQQALAQAFGLEPAVVAHRLLTYVQAAQKSRNPSAELFQTLVAPEALPLSHGVRPYAFRLAQPLQQSPRTLGDIQHWRVEWAYGGLPVQLLRRGPQTLLWGAEGQLLNAQFPEILALGAQLPDGTALQGELLAWAPGQPGPQPAARLQIRLKLKAPGPAALRDTPVRLLAGELLQLEGQDLRHQAQRQRHAALHALAQTVGFSLAQALPVTRWEALHTLRDNARLHHALGLLLKPLTADDRAEVGADTRTAWLWLADALRVNTLLVYAQSGSGRWGGPSAGPAEYTFAVWNRPPAGSEEVAQVLHDIQQRQPPRPGGLQLLPIARVQTGLSDEQQQELEHLVREYTVQSFGPVRSLLPTVVMDLALDSISRSTRHKSGVSTRGARLLRIRADTSLLQAATLQDLQPLLD